MLLLFIISNSISIILLLTSIIIINLSIQCENRVAEDESTTLDTNPVCARPPHPAWS